MTDHNSEIKVIGDITLADITHWWYSILYEISKLLIRLSYHLQRVSEYYWRDHCCYCGVELRCEHKKNCPRWVCK